MILPTQDDVIIALKSFMLDRLPDGTDVVQGVENRVAESIYPNFAVMTLIRTVRLSTNVDTPEDVKFTASIAPGVAAFTGSIVPAPGIPGVMPSGILTVTAVSSGTVVKGGLVTGGGVLGATFVTGQLSGTPGGIGSYAVSKAQAVRAGSLGLSYGLMTVTAVEAGAIAVGANVYGVGVTAPSIVRALGSGAGGIGTYVLGPTQTVASKTISAGVKTIRQNSTFTVQIDFHSGDATTASDMAQTIATAFRDAYAVQFFSELTGGTISPLFADDPRFTPFQNENQQYERRWVLDANLQVNQTIRVPAQYADFAGVELISVDAAYPPAP